MSGHFDDSKSALAVNAESGTAHALEIMGLYCISWLYNCQDRLWL